MDGQQLVIGGRLGRKAGLGPNRAKEVDPRPESPRGQRVGRAEVVGRRARPEDEQRAIVRCRASHAWHDTWHGADLHDPPSRQARREARRAGLDRRRSRLGHPRRARRAHPRRDHRRAAPGHGHRPPRRRLSGRARQPAGLRERLVPNGAIWVVSRKGRSATLRDVDVIAAARASGLIDNKVASFSPTHTALRLVIPVALRPPARSTD